MPGIGVVVKIGGSQAASIIEMIIRINRIDLVFLFMLYLLVLIDNSSETGGTLSAPGVISCGSQTTIFR